MKKSKALTTKQEQKLANNVPKWIAEKEEIATAQYQSSQEFLLAVEDCLVKYHGFSEKQLKELEEQLKYLLHTLGNIERKGLSILNPRDMFIVGEIAEIRRQRLETARTGIALPSGQEMDKLKKLIGGKN